MARRLQAAGYPLTVWNRTKEEASGLPSAGARWGDSPKAVGRGSDVVITMCTDSAASEEVICGGEWGSGRGTPGLDGYRLGKHRSGNVKAIAERARAKGIPMLDAPVTGNPKVAAEGKLGIMVGGPKETFDACFPIFEKMAVKIFHAARGT